MEKVPKTAIKRGIQIRTVYNQNRSTSLTFAQSMFLKTDLVDTLYYVHQLPIKNHTHAACTTVIYEPDTTQFTRSPHIKFHRLILHAHTQALFRTSTPSSTYHEQETKRGV